MKFFILISAGVLFSLGGKAQLSFGTYFNQYRTFTGSSVENASASQGVGVAVLYRDKNSPFSVGLEVGKGSSDSRTFDQTVHTSNHGLVLTEVTERQLDIHAQALVRYTFFSDAPLEPYAEGRVGNTSFMTSRSVGDGISVETGEEVVRKSEMKEEIACMDYHSTTFQAGIGLGTIINLKHLICPTEEDYGFEVKLDMGATYLLGTNAIYNESSGEVNNPIVHQRPGNNFNYRLGVIMVLK